MTMHMNLISFNIKADIRDGSNGYPKHHRCLLTSIHVHHLHVVAEKTALESQMVFE
jgi:hypothetical protein